MAFVLLQAGILHSASVSETTLTGDFFVYPAILCNQYRRYVLGISFNVRLTTIAFVVHILLEGQCSEVLIQHHSLTTVPCRDL
jgi:hypothetical protein